MCALETSVFHPEKAPPATDGAFLFFDRPRLFPSRGTKPWTISTTEVSAYNSNSGTFRKMRRAWCSGIRAATRSTGAGRLCPAQDAPRWLCENPDAATVTAGALEPQRPLGKVRRPHVPCRRRRTGDGAEAHVVPVSRADLQQGAALVAGASDPLRRVRRLPPQ